MSIKLMTLVWDSDHLKGSELLALLALSDFANDDGYCWPSANRLGKKIRLSERQAQRVLNSLEAQGFIETVNQGGIGARDSNTYRVIIAKLTEKKYDISGELTKMKYDTQRGKYDTQRAISTTSSASTLYIEPSIESSIESSTRAREIAPGFHNPSTETGNHNATQRVHAVRQGEETITFSTPILLQQQPSPPVASTPPMLGVAFSPVEPITPASFTVNAQIERCDSQKVFGEYFPNKTLSVRQWGLIAETVTDIQKWIRVCQRWAEVYGEDWRKFGLLDWYKDGIKGEGENRNGRYSKSTAGNSGSFGAEEPSEYAAYQ